MESGRTADYFMPFLRLSTAFLTTVFSMGGAVNSVVAALCAISNICSCPFLIILQQNCQYFFAARPPIYIIWQLAEGF